MKDQHAPAHFGRTIAANVAALAVFAVLSFAATRVFNGVPAGEAVQAGAAIVAIAVALRLHARAAAFVLTAILAFTASEFFAHAMWGNGVVQGAQTHLTVLAAGALGVLFGAVLVRLTGRASGAQDTAGLTVAATRSSTGT